MWTQKAPNGKIQYCERYWYLGKRRVFSVTFDHDSARNRKEAIRLKSYFGKSHKSSVFKGFTVFHPFKLCHFMTLFVISCHKYGMKKGTCVPLQLNFVLFRLLTFYEENHTRLLYSNRNRRF